MMQLVVKAAFGYAVTDPSPVWTDISDRVHFPTGVSITRGASDELGETQAGTCSMVLDNSDGRFTSGRAASPYYPNVKKNTPIKVQVVTAKNLISNPSFESDLTGWIKTASPTIVQDNAHVQHGSQAMRITWGAPTGQAVGTVIDDLEIGQVYTASAYVWRAAGSPTLTLYILGMVATSVTAMTGAFERLTFTFTATATQHTLYVQTVSTPTAGTQCWVDAVQLEEGSVATAFDSSGFQTYDRFWGMVNDWPVTWAGLYSTVTITCTDIFKWLSRHPALSPMLTEEVLLDRPFVYYPLAEPSDSTSAGDLTGTASVGTLATVQAGSGGTLEFASGTGPPGSVAPLFTPVSATAGKYLTADLGPNFTDANVSFRMRMECWFSTTTAGRVIMAVTAADSSNKVIISLDSATGRLKIETAAAAASGNLVNATIDPTPNLADGQQHYLLYHELESVAYVDGVAYNVSNAGSMISMRVLSVGGYGNDRLWSGSISHVAIYLRSVTGAELTPHYTIGSTELVGEAADDRMSRITSYLPLAAVTTQGSTFDGMASQAALGRTPLDHLQEVAATESGKLLAARGGNGLVFQSRDVRYNPTASLSLDYADLETGDVALSDDDQKMLNTVIASRPGGATQRVVDQAARDTYGPYEQQVDLLKSSDLKVVDAANWLVSRYADPSPEIRQVPVQAYTLPMATYRALLAADVSTVLDLTGLPDQAPTPTATVTVEGYTELIQNKQHRLDLRTSRALTDTVWALDSAAYSQLGATTRLAY
ncbi:carbohydrate binding domain-containing protein [Streptomyces sp. RTd22]|uniref:carbohydrate binding domain-containing protein n=1 Tax=Streptomyces sp. RTd22 TaxID=1841249 RepID=UPI0007C49A6B|nr:carbohydrate binding domain-containing protein [Streptomyces sp. RTd22]